MMDQQDAVGAAMHTEVMKAPQSVAEVGVRRPFLEDLALKIIYVTAPPTLVELASTMCLGYTVVDDLFRRLRSEQIVEVTGMKGNAPQIALTSRGRSRALELLNLSHYVGAAPVSLQSYIEQTRRQSVRDLAISPADVSRAFAHMVLEETTLTKLGTALNSGASIFLYGPSGTGKTTIAMAIPKALAEQYVWIPYSVQVDGQVITVYDPHLHTKFDGPVPEGCDQRWVFCHRPTVLVGGELTLEMLELQLNPITKFYTAPVQMKANNGVLIIDDFGRQRLSPNELLNRWVVPLDRGIDFLTLAGGKKLEIPFEMFVVFATNLSPSTLADPAFLRRIQTKIKVGTLSAPQFHDIFQRVCDQCGMDYRSELVDDLIDSIHKKGEPLRACHPRDLVNQIRWAARYESRVPSLERESLSMAIDAYFISEDENGEHYPLEHNGGLHRGPSPKGDLDAN
jgi:energy-coupling factor transporter ATP-binding protein EcfA2